MENLKDWIEPEEVAQAKRAPLFKSRFNPKQAPTNSTFIKRKHVPEGPKKST